MLYRSILIAAAVAAALSAQPVASQTIIDEWASVKPPSPPELKPVKLDPKTTAFLALDLLKGNCNEQRRPRCVASLPKVKAALDAARAKGVTVVYSIFPGSKVEAIWESVAPKPGEAIVQAPSDKFLGSDLEKILKDKGIQTVIATGAAAHGAVLYTASEAAYRGFKVVVPVDGMSSENTYFEQYTAFQLLNLPGAPPGAMTLTRLDMIGY